MTAPALLLSNPPRGKNGRFKKATRRSTPRKSTRSASRRTSRPRANPPAKRSTRRRRSSIKPFALKTLLPQTAAGLGGFMLADAGTRMVIKALPDEVRSKAPAWAGPIIKGGVAVAAGMALSSKHMPNEVRKYGPALALGGLISAGGDAWTMVRPKLMSGYWDPRLPAGGGRPMMGYDDPSQPAARRVHTGDVVDLY